MTVRGCVNFFTRYAILVAAGSGDICIRCMPKDDRRPFSGRSTRGVPGERRTQSGPAAGASYTLIGAIILLGGIGYAIDRWRGTVAVGSGRRAAARHRRRVYELAKTVWQR